METSSSNPDIQTAKTLSVPTEDNEIKEVSPKKEHDPETLYTEGIALQKEGKIEESLQSLSTALELVTKTRGELHDSVYKFYYAYADSLLIQYQKDNDGNIFGEAVPQQVACQDSGSDSGSDSASQDPNEPIPSSSEHVASPPAPTNQDYIEEHEGSSFVDSNEEESDEEESFEEDSKEEKSAKESSDKEAPNTGSTTAAQANPSVAEETNDLQLAWESLDIARVILNKLNPPDKDFLYKVQSRLGDLFSYRELFDNACEEYFAALGTLKSIEGLRPSREQAYIHYLIGTNMLNSKDKESEAADHFKQSYAILDSVLMITESEEARKEIREAMEDLKIKIEDAMEQKESVNALKTMGDLQSDRFDPPQMSEVVDLGVVQRKKVQPMGDPEFPEGNDDKKRMDS